MGKSEAGDEAGGAVGPPAEFFYDLALFMVHFWREFGREERFTIVFLPFSGVSDRAPAGKQRSALLNLVNERFGWDFFR